MCTLTVRILKTMVTYRKQISDQDTGAVFDKL